jgi:hypothetical protein
LKPRTEFLAWFVGALALYAAGTHDRVFTAGNDASRWAQIESLVDHGRKDIGASRFRRTVDRVRIGELEYSNKPPFLSLIGAGVYAAVRGATGWRLADPGAHAAIRAVTIVLVGIPSALLVAGFRRALDRFAGVAVGTRRLLTVALAAGTLLFSYSVTLNNHTVAAALLFGGFAAALSRRALAAGALCGLAAAVDLLPGLGMAPFLLAATALGAPAAGRVAGRFAAGLAVGVAALVGSNLFVVGSIWTPKLVPGAYDLSAQAGPSAGGVVLPESWTYPLECLFGGHGLFAVSPVLLLGAWGLVEACRRPPFAGRPLWLAVAAGVALQVVVHVLLAGSYGGWSYGYRYLLPVQPLLLFAAGAVVAGSRARLARALLYALLPVAVVFAALGAYNPWPPAYEQETNHHPVASLVTNPIGGNAAAFAAARAPDGSIARWLARRFVSEDPAAARSYFRLFFGSKGDIATMRRFEP